MGRRAARLFSSAEAREMLEEFRALVRAGVLRVTADNDLVFTKPGGEWTRDWPRPVPAPSADDELKKVDEQVFDWVRRNRERQELSSEHKATPEDSSIDDVRDQVVERLTDKILHQWETGGGRTLQEEVVDRITIRILKRWAR